MIINITNGSLSSVSGTLKPTFYSSAFLPDTISVTGASSTYNATSGIYTLSAPTTSTISMTAIGDWAFSCVVSNLSGYSTLSGGTHAMQVRLLASDYVDGELSDTVSFEVPYTVSYSLTGCSVTSQGTGTSSSLIYAGIPLVLDISVSAQYALPDSVAVTGASYVYDKANNTLTLSNPTGPVSVTIICESVVSGYIVNVSTPGGGVIYGDFYDGATTSGTYLGSGEGTYVSNSGYLTFIAVGPDLNVDSVSSGITYTFLSDPEGVLFTITSDGNISMYDATISCFAKGTFITLANGSTKLVEDISYNDDLLVWDFDKGQFTTSKPLWIKKTQTCKMVDCARFGDGSEIQFVDDHRIFNYQAGKFTYIMADETPINTITLTDKGQYINLIAKYSRPIDTEYYNIVTAYHMNVFAGHVLTSCRLSNLYPIVNMRYVDDGHPHRDPSEFKDLPEAYVTGLRLLEQPDLKQEEHDKHKTTLNDYVKRLLFLAAPQEEKE